MTQSYTTALKEPLEDPIHIGIPKFGTLPTRINTPYQDKLSHATNNLDIYCFLFFL